LEEELEEDVLTKKVLKDALLGAFIECVVGEVEQSHLLLQLLL
jgi:hypothetical protein